MLEFWIAISAAIVGGAAGYVAAYFQAHRELGRRKRAIATALLADLAAMEVQLADAYQAAHDEPLKQLPPVAVLGRFTDYVDVLSGESVNALSVVQATIEALPSRLELLKRRYPGKKEVGPYGRVNIEAPDPWPVEFVTAGALLAIDKAHRCLVADGGAAAEPEPIDWVTYPSVPALPPRITALIENRWLSPNRSFLPTREDRERTPENPEQDTKRQGNG